MFGLQDIFTSWSATADLKSFEHALEVSFEANLAYSFLLRLWRFSDNIIHRWRKNEELRVLPAVAENPLFNAPKFMQTLDHVQICVKWAAHVINFIAITWAVGAALLAVLLLWSIPYCEGCQVSGRHGLSLELFFLGALPAGFALFCFVLLIAMIVMKYNSFSFNGVIKYYRKQTENLRRYGENLDAKLA